jgi:plastocyanin
MQRTYLVNQTTWRVAGYLLKRGDTIEFVDRDAKQHTVKINHSYFTTPLWVNEEDFYAHCVKLL